MELVCTQASERRATEDSMLRPSLCIGPCILPCAWLGPKMVGGMINGFDVAGRVAGLVI